MPLCHVQSSTLAGMFIFPDIHLWDTRHKGLKICCHSKFFATFQVMSRKFFTSIATEEVQARLWIILISRVAESENPYEAAQLRKGLRKVSLDAGVIITKIESLQLSTKATSIRAAQAKRIKQ